MRPPEDDDVIRQHLLHLRDRHGMRILDCDACGGAGCSLCDFSGVGGMDFPNSELREPCGPKCPCVEMVAAPERESVN